VLTTTNLCLNLNRFSKIHQKLVKELNPVNLPEVPRLILVASGTIPRDGKGRSLAKDDLTPETLKLNKNEN